MGERHIRASEVSRLKAVTRRALDHAGTAVEFQHLTRVNNASLSRYANPDQAEMMPIDIVLDLEREIGHPWVTEALAQLQGFELVASNARRILPDDQASLIELMPKLAKEQSELMNRVVVALGDNHVSENECRAIEQELDDVADLLRQCRARLAYWREKNAAQGGAS